MTDFLHICEADLRRILQDKMLECSRLNAENTRLRRIIDAIARRALERQAAEIAERLMSGSSTVIQ